MPGAARLIAQLNVPVREIDEMLPEIVLRRSKRDLNKRPPLRSLGLPDQAHVCFTRKSVALACIAGDAGTNHVFPSRRSTSVARHDMIQIKLAAIEQLAAVLAGALVSLKYVVPGEFYFLFRKAIEHKEHDHPRDADLKRNRRDHFVVRRVRRQIAPAFEVVRRKIARVIRRNNLGVSCVYEGQGAPCRADVHGLPEPVQYQNLTVQQRMQGVTAWYSAFYGLPRKFGGRYHWGFSLSMRGKDCGNPREVSCWLCICDDSCPFVVT